ncbi:MAG: NUDIX domain-containing protein [Anaerolineales bacterium]|nr:NUDIX domain-containing protein [Anaerolineales bacterium]
MKPGIDYIGVGVGAMVFNERGEVFLSQRGPKATNERGCWEFPGGKVDFGETLAEAIVREFREEYELEIEVIELLKVADHILPNEGQHWVSPTFIARHASGTPRIVEPEKCSAIGWFTMDALPEPLSVISKDDVKAYREKFPVSKGDE